MRNLLTRKSFRLRVWRIGLLLIIPLVIPLSCQGNYYLVTRVIDGDTIVLENGEKVRLIGIDTFPTREGTELDRAVKRTGMDKESIKALGRRAREFTKGLCEGKTVRLEYDVERKEKTNEWKLKIYGPPRTLAYVYVDGIFVNAWLVENGYARASPYPPNVRYKELFQELE